jgi:anti-sigma factor RsiW
MQMFANNNHKNSCDFSDQIVAFVYDEIGNSERNIFEKHIETCASCAKDVASFSEAHLLVRAWRDDEFASLASSEIALPTSITNSGTGINLWFERIASLIAISPTRIAFASAVVLALFFAGIFFVAVNRDDQRHIAANVGQPSASVNGNDSGKSPQETRLSVSNASHSGETVPNSAQASTREIQQPNSAPVEKTIRTNVGRLSTVPKPHSFATTNVRKPVNQVKRNETEIPQIQLEIDSDSNDGVRLRDIFDEVSMR